MNLLGIGLTAPRPHPTIGRYQWCLYPLPVSWPLTPQLHSKSFVAGRYLGLLPSNHSQDSPSHSHLPGPRPPWLCFGLVLARMPGQSGPWQHVPTVLQEGLLAQALLPPGPVLLDLLLTVRVETQWVSRARMFTGHWSPAVPGRHSGLPTSQAAASGDEAGECDRMGVYVTQEWRPRLFIPKGLVSPNGVYYIF